ncbi:MAG: hypothetical protein O3B75_08290 [Planctomycetota bacterium]|nr:hypothetical protein [Planctomycetota bacterium]
MNTKSIIDQTLSQRMETLEARIAELQHADHRARRWKILAVSAGVALISLAGLAATRPSQTAEVIRARRFEVVDQNDKIVLLAGIGQNGGQIDVWSNSGTNVLRFGANNDGGDLAIWNNAGSGVASVYATSQGGRIEAIMPDESGSVRICAETGGPSMAIVDGQGHPRLVAAMAGTSTGINIRSAAGEELAAMGAVDGEGGIIRVAQNDGTLAAQMVAFKTGGSIGCANSNGSRSAVLESAQNDTGGVMKLFRADGTEAIAAMAQSESGARFSLFGSLQQPVAILESGINGMGMISFLQGTTRVAGLGSSTNGGLLNLAKADGKAVVIAGAASDADGGAISVRSGSGSQLVRIGVDRVGAGEVAVYDGPGTRKRVLSAISSAP